MLTLEQYNQQQAQKALDSGVYNTVYSNIYNFKININKCNLKDLNKEDKKQVLKARENIKRLEAIARGEELDPIYGIYYVNIYLKEYAITNK